MTKALLLTRGLLPACNVLASPFIKIYLLCGSAGKGLKFDGRQQAVNVSCNYGISAIRDLNIVLGPSANINRMPKSILKLIFFIVAATNVKLGLSQNSEWKVLKLPDGWAILAPQEVIREDFQGIDSYVGKIYSVEDSLSLEFDIGKSFTIRINKFDCSLKTQTREANKYLRDSSFKVIYNIPQVNKAYIDTINGRIATIIVPKVIGNGITYVSITDCKTGDWLGITGSNLSLSQYNLVLRMFRTINR